MNLLPQYVIALTLTAITFFTMGIFVLLKNKKRTLNITFALHFISIAVWSLFEAIGISETNKQLALIFWRINHIGVIFIPVFLIHFIFTLLNLTEKKRKILYIVYSTAAVFLVLDATRLLIADVVPKFSFRFFIEPGVVYPLFFFLWIFGAVYAHSELFKAYSASSGARRNELKYHFWGLMTAYIGGTPNFLPTFYIELYPYNPYGTYGIIIYAIILTYAIARYRLLDITLVFRGSIVFLFYIAISLGIIVPLHYLTKHSLTLILFVDIGIIAAAPFVYHFLRKRSLSVVDSVLFKGKYNYVDRLNNFVEEMVLIPKEDKLFETTVNVLKMNMNPAKIALLIQDPVNHTYYIKDNAGITDADSFTLSEKNKIITWLKRYRHTFLLEEGDKILSSAEMKTMKEELAPLEAKVCVPITVDKDLLGVIALSNKSSAEMYSHLDLELLERLGKQLAVAVNYRRIESQLRKEHELTAMGILAMEIGHEMRNLLVAPYTFIDMLDYRKDDPEFMTDFKSLAMDRLRVIRGKLDDIMYFGKEHPLKLTPGIEIPKLIDDTLMANNYSITSNNINIDKFFNGVPPIKGDHDHLVHLFNNLILNAIDAMESKDIKGGKLRIQTSINKNINSEMAGRSDRWIRVEIGDDGEGIPEHIRHRLFTPFVTTKSGGGIKRKGTGLGLSVVKKAVDAHRGYIFVHTTEGKGTTMIIDLPVDLKIELHSINNIDLSKEPWEQ